MSQFYKNMWGKLDQIHPYYAEVVGCAMHYADERAVVGAFFAHGGGDYVKKIPGIYIYIYILRWVGKKGKS